MYVYARGLALRVVHESTTFKGMRVRVSVVLHLKPFLSQVNWLLRFLTVRPLDPLLSLELTCLDKGPETGGFSHVLGVVGIISIFMYEGDGDQLINGSTAAVVIFFLLMCVKRLLLSLTPLLWYDTHTI